MTVSFFTTVVLKVRVTSSRFIHATVMFFLYLQSAPVNACSMIFLDGKSVHGRTAVLPTTGGCPSLKL